MIKAAFYGKGGIGKSTIVSNLSAALAEKELKVLQIGCDPKADSTINLLGGEKIKTILELVREKGNSTEPEEVVHKGYNGVLCAEAGGPTPGLGCAGRGITTAIELLEEKGITDIYNPDVIFYDVLGDVVCGGFAVPIRNGYADNVFIVTSGENMSIHAAANIAVAVQNFEERGYASLRGIILNSREVKNEKQKVEELASDVNSAIIGTISFSQTVRDAEELGQTVIEAFPESEIADEYRQLADAVIRACASTC